MNTTVGIMFGVLVALADAPAVAQSRLTPKDYGGFYNDVILKANNGSKAEWLACDDPVITFVARVLKWICRVGALVVPEQHRGAPP